MSALRATVRLARVVPRSSAVATPSRCLSTARPVVRQPAMLAAANLMQRRTYASTAGLSKQDVESRIHELLKSFEKVDVAKISNSATFTSDLGLDSLDAVEVVMAVEEEFNIEIPDQEADMITSVQQAIDYVLKSPEAI